MESRPETPREPNTIYVGKKPAMAYVLATLNLIQSGSEGVTIRARGKAVSRAVDVAQILTKKFATDIKVKSVSIDTEQVQSNFNDSVSDVSSIEIKLHRQSA